MSVSIMARGIAYSQLAQENQCQGQGGDACVRRALAALTAVDGTVLRAVQRIGGRG
jgi:hypothetical protein